MKQFQSVTQIFLNCFSRCGKMNGDRSPFLLFFFHFQPKMQMDFFKVEPNSDPSTSEAKEGTLLRIQIKMWYIDYKLIHDYSQWDEAKVEFTGLTYRSISTLQTTHP